MNYTEIKTVSQSIADRFDTDTTNNLDNFLRIVESKINHKLQVMEKETALSIAIVAATFDYALPADYGSLRSIHWEHNGRRVPMTLITPEKYDDIRDKPTTVPTENLYSHPFIGYVIKEDRRLYITQDLEVGDIKGTYLQRVPQLTSGNANNWVSDDYPEAYLFGMVAEIKAFAKNNEGFVLWDGRFKEALQDIIDDDAHQKWSGTPMRMRTE